MTPNEYQKDAIRTEDISVCAMSINYPYPRLLQGLMGLSGESGECLDLLKKHLFQGHELDYTHMAKELGDVAWYLAISAAALGYDLETILQMNVEKRKERYPEGFDSNKSRNRKPGDI